METRNQSTLRPDDGDPGIRDAAVRELSRDFVRDLEHDGGLGVHDFRVAEPVVKLVIHAERTLDSSIRMQAALTGAAESQRVQ